jgi:ATP-GRASP peptide maturase of grasp-with-spasm system
MIVIFSNNQDYSTFDVMQWLQFFGSKKVIRINSRNLNNRLIKKVCLNGKNGEFQFTIENESFFISDIEAVWYRKGVNWLNDEFFKINIKNEAFISNYLTSKMEGERKKLGEFIDYIITKSCSVLGNPFKSDLNKLIVLEKARELNLKVPDYVVSNSVPFIIDFLNETKPGAISKAMSDGVYKFDDIKSLKGYFTYTEELFAKDLDELNVNLPPSFIQKKVEKSFEVRVFFLEDEFYSMAIFSQNDEKTKVDFRKYNEDKPNRFIPYLLPDHIQKKLLHLFKSLGLNTGSADLLVDENDTHYFLEINPVGQFGMVSLPCNYNLEKKVAINLLNKCRKK